MDGDIVLNEKERNAMAATRALLKRARMNG
jgi:hypothetical protein